MEKRWVYKTVPDKEDVSTLAEQINVNAVLAGLLVQRNIRTFDEAKAFFRPQLSQLHDPYLMLNMAKAIERLGQALDNDEKILVYGDYDVDGTTAVALFYGFLRQYHPKISFYIPDRYKEGYGISEEGIRHAFDNGYSLIITLDCGIKAVSKINRASSKGVDFIICDHHRPGDDLPQAHAILDPKQDDCPYPYKELTGCGVGFKLLQAFCLKRQIDIDLLYNYLDLIAVSIASDIVPIDGENRVLAYYGLKMLNDKPSSGLEALKEVAGLKNDVSISAIVFGIGPRINAAGRVAHANTAVHLLLSQSKEEATNYANNVESKNVLRRDFDNNITQEALELIAAEEANQHLSTTVLYKHDWHKGVIGIVASRCIEKYYRPTIILTESNNKATGSARSVDGFDVYDAISQCSEYLDQFGGHSYAAGLTMDIDKIDAFKQKFEAVVANTITQEQLIPQLEIDLSINFDVITEKFYSILQQMGPFGPGNLKPVFVSERVYAASYPSPRLLKNAHVKISVRQENANTIMPAIGFGMAPYYEMISSGMRFHMAYTVEENNYMGNRYLQLNIKDIKFDV